MTATTAVTDQRARRSAVEAAKVWLSVPITAEPLGEGHINDTWLVVSPAGRFVLQRLSAAVFPHPAEVAAKVSRVVEHLSRGKRVPVPALLATTSGGRWHEDDHGAVWRLWEYLAGTRALQRLATPDQGRAAGAAFGTFQLAVADLPGGATEPVPGFLQLPRYLSELDAAAGTPADGAVEAALDFIDSRRQSALPFTEPDRLIHGDCKINNLLFHAHRDEVAAVIDLDTVMLGHWAWDFGDLARSAAAGVEGFDVSRFAAVAAGFTRSGALQNGAGGDVVDALVQAPRHVALMLGVRFLTDHLRGDRYFKVAYAGENLDRARHQLALVDDMERQERAMATAVRHL